MFSDSQKVFGSREQKGQHTLVELPERLALNSFVHFPFEEHDRHAMTRHYSIRLNLNFLARPNLVAF
jgi:hypothetical protein